MCILILIHIWQKYLPSTRPNTLPWIFFADVQLGFSQYSINKGCVSVQTWAFYNITERGVNEEVTSTPHKQKCALPQDKKLFWVVLLRCEFFNNQTFVWIIKCDLNSHSHLNIQSYMKIINFMFLFSLCNSISVRSVFITFSYEHLL